MMGILGGEGGDPLWSQVLFLVLLGNQLNALYIGFEVGSAHSLKWLFFFKFKIKIKIIF